jgi:hypothetical protein
LEEKENDRHRQCADSNGSQHRIPLGPKFADEAVDEA